MKIDGFEVMGNEEILIRGPYYDLNWYRRVLIFLRIKKLEQYKIHHGIYEVTSMGSINEPFIVVREEEE